MFASVGNLICFPYSRTISTHVMLERSHYMAIVMKSERKREREIESDGAKTEACKNPLTGK